MTTVVVRSEDHAAARQSGEGHVLVSAIVDFVNAMQRSGVYARHELLAALMQAYNADYYLAQVNNGGHSQFIRNARATLSTSVADALAGLQAMGAHALHQILTEMAAWVKADPEEAAVQNGFSVRALLLDELDERFCEAERETPMSELSAKWIASWPQLRVVPADQYAGEIERLAQLNPHLEARRIWQSVEQLRFQMTDRLQITVAVACGAVRPQPEVKLALHAGSHMEIEGQTCMAFGLRTDKGLRLCVLEDAGGRLYEFIKSNPLPNNASPEAWKTYPPMAAGARLSTVRADRIQQFIKIADQARCAEAIDLLLRRADLDTTATITAWEAFDASATWIVATGQTRVTAAIADKGAVLTGSDQTQIVSISRSEINDHASRAAIGGDTMCPPN